MCIYIYKHTCVCVCLVSQSCPSLCDPVDYSSPGFSVHGILQVRILVWVAIPFSRGSFFLNQELNLGLMHCRQILYYLSHQVSLKIWGLQLKIIKNLKVVPTEH